MPFRVMARTVIQLGAELISSDGVAFYELIKNAFDAGSPRVDIDVIVRRPYERSLALVETVLAEREVRRTKTALGIRVPCSSRAALRRPFAGPTSISPISASDVWENICQSMSRTFQFASPPIEVSTTTREPSRMTESRPMPFSPRTGFSVAFPRWPSTWARRLRVPIVRKTLSKSAALIPVPVSCH